MSSKISAGKKFLTLEDLESTEKGPVWVLNNTSGKDGARILINIPKMSGNGNDLVKIHKTFIPMNIANQVPKSQLLASSEFRKCVNNKEISLITTEYASVLLDTEESKEEQRIIDNEASRIKAILAGTSLLEKENSKDVQVSAKLQTLVAEAADKNEITIVAELRRYGHLTLDECKFVNSKLGKISKVKSLLKDRVEVLKGERETA
jgi:hypothetical protein